MGASFFPLSLVCHSVTLSIMCVLQPTLPHHFQPLNIITVIQKKGSDTEVPYVHMQLKAVDQQKTNLMSSIFPGLRYWAYSHLVLVVYRELTGLWSSMEAHLNRKKMNDWTFCNKKTCRSDKHHGRSNIFYIRTAIYELIYQNCSHN